MPYVAGPVPIMGDKQQSLINLLWLQLQNIENEFHSTLTYETLFGVSDMERRAGVEAVDPHYPYWDARRWGVKGNGVIDDSPAIRTCEKFASANQCAIYFGGNIYNYRMASTVRLGRNVKFYGDHDALGVEFVPDAGIQPFSIDGYMGPGDVPIPGNFAYHVTLQDLTIDASKLTTSLEQVILMKNCYRCNLINVRIRALPNVAGQVQAGVRCQLICNNNLISGCEVTGPLTGTPEGSGLLYEHTKGTIISFQNDTEELWRGQHLKGCANVDIYSPYVERCRRGIRFEACVTPLEDIPQWNVNGGRLALGSSTAWGFEYAGDYENEEMISIAGTQIVSDDHSTKKSGYKVEAGFSCTNMNKWLISGIDASWIEADVELQPYTVWVPNTPAFV